MLFSELAASQLPDYLEKTVAKLLDLKMNSPEVKMIPRIDIPQRLHGSEHCRGACSGGAVSERNHEGLGGTQCAVPRRTGDVIL